MSASDQCAYCWEPCMGCAYDDEPGDQCVSSGADIGHYLGCPDDPDPDWEAEARVRELTP